MTETEEAFKIIEIKKLHCLRCGYYWLPRYENVLPRTCANCGSPYWDRPRRVKKQKKE